MSAIAKDSVMGGPTASERSRAQGLTHREVELGGIIDAYNEVTERLKESHEMLTGEVRQLREQLREKDRELERGERLAALGEMAAGVAHEVRNPLGGILLYASMLERDLAGQPGPRGVAEQIAGAARKLDEIVSDILAFADRSELRCRPVLLNDLVLEVVELLKPRWMSMGCEVSLEVGSDCKTIEADAVQLQRALLNVVSNAVEAAGEGGHVWITIGGLDVGCGGAVVSVADDGPGVPAELRDRIFNPFFTTKDSGTGLGLAIVHGIVELHGGTVSVKDRAGGGAVFTVRLPEQQRSDGSGGEQD